MADININPIQIGALAALASQGVPNLQLQQTSGPLGALFAAQAQIATNQNTVKADYARMANDLIMKKYEQEQENARNYLTNQTSLQTNQNTVDAQKADALMRYQAQQNRTDVEQQHYQNQDQMAQKNFDLDSWYKQAGLGQKQQELLHQQVKDAYDMKMKQDEFNLKVQEMAGNAYLASDKSPAAQQAYIDRVAPTMDDAHVKILKDAMKSGNLENIVAMNSTLNAEVFKEKAKGGMTITTNPDGTTTVQMGGQGMTSQNQSKAQEKIQNSQMLSGMASDLINQIKSNPDLFTTKGNVAAFAGTQLGRNSFLQSLAPEDAKQYADQQDKAATQYDTTASTIKAEFSKQISTRLLNGEQQFLNDLLPNRKKQDADSALIQAQTFKRLQDNIATLNSQYLTTTGVPTDKTAYENGIRAAFRDAQQVYQQASALPTQSTDSTQQKVWNFNPTTGKLE